MIRRQDRINLLKNKLDSFKGFDGSLKERQLFTEAMDNIETEINIQLSKFIKVY